MSWTRAVFLGLEWAWCLLGLLCLGASASLLLKPELSRRLKHLEDFPRLRPALWALGLLPPVLIAVFKLAQFHSFQLMFDSGLSANLAWNALHGVGLSHCSVLGDQTYFSVHFSFTMALLAPLLLIWESTAILALAYGLAIGSMVPAAFLIGRRLCTHRTVPWALALLTMSHRFFHDVGGSPIDNNGFPGPLGLWAAWLWLSGRRGLSILLGLALFTPREQTPFLFFGVGLFFLTRAWTLLRRDRSSSIRAAWVGAALAICSALAWAFELLVIRSAQLAFPECAINYWAVFKSLGGAQGAVLHRLLTSPWDILIAMVHPFKKLGTAAEVFLPFGLLPLFSGAALWPVLTTWAPHQLADYGTEGFHALNSQAGSILLGPLVVASASGVNRLLGLLGAAGRRRLFACLLAVAGAGFFRNSGWQLPPGLIPSAWPKTGPRALALIPKNAKVWSDEFFLPQLALRRYVKVLPRAYSENNFQVRLFAPDWVLLSAGWVRLAQPGVPDQVMEFLKTRGYQPVFREADLVVLASPEALKGELLPLEWVSLAEKRQAREKAAEPAPGAVRSPGS
ncbi:MAG: DUF2079 domain-containing protein [Elusimicrobia bacterium]|nr:DUF2079 domain-containing protein [Elusimicrobiota bacterium]